MSDVSVNMGKRCHQLRSNFILLAIGLMAMGVGCSRSPHPTSMTRPTAMNAISAMQLTSSAFPIGAVIPKRYSFDGDNINPPLHWDQVPSGTRTFALTMEDPDVPPAARVPVWDHWLVWNIPSVINDIPERWTVVGVAGQGTGGTSAYSGPRPPDREHRYFFHVYALDTALSLPAGSTKAQLLSAMAGHLLGQAELVGRFSPPRR